MPSSMRSHPVRCVHLQLLLAAIRLTLQASLNRMSATNHLQWGTFSTILISLVLFPVAQSNFYDDFVITGSTSNVRFLGAAGDELQLVLNSDAGSGFASKTLFLFGKIDMEIKLIPGDSAGTVTSYYLSSETANHDELDFEFLGNTTGEPYILQTNIFSNGHGGREQRIYLWFNPSDSFHTYSVAWTPQRILFLVDDVLIRVFSNNEAAGVPYPSKQPMRVFSSIWNGDQWATQGGRVKINWAHAPFVASYRKFKALSNDQLTAADIALDKVKLDKLAWVKQNFVLYDYCTDHNRYPLPPPDCTHIG
ncbi:hypothetical protein KP509_08G066600 [Ceratopteris richardii]|uniref:Xyloglucan endotransglucosylase/hydrolase n=1 Tax=Ceratopteris richardii TaxID=49495 RepID=A0A8T2UB87_CERRI|nr:hypothetical protein KP509_08G066600 [Ceratopteris richardii]